MEREQAAELFAEAMYERAISYGITFFNELLDSPPPSTEQWTQFREHYAAADADQKRMYDFVVKEAIRGAVVNFAVYLDGATSYQRLQDKLLVFTVGLEVYPDSDNEEVIPEEGEPEDVVNICPNSGGSDVHDLLLNILDERLL